MVSLSGYYNGKWFSKNGFQFMILYRLRCADEHSFEAWFRDSASYDEQVAAGDVECPYCGSTAIAKAPMAPNISSHKGSMEDASARQPIADMDAEAMDQRAHEVAQQILDAVGRVRQYAEDNFEDVGEAFADEARKIHYGDAEERGIYGKATDEEAQDLEDEGIDFVRLPGTPRRNS